MARLRSGDRIALAPGAETLARYEEWTEGPGYGWAASLCIEYGRITCLQNWDEKRKVSTNRSWLRKRMVETLDRIAPGWKVVKNEQQS